MSNQDDSSPPPQQDGNSESDHTPKKKSHKKKHHKKKDKNSYHDDDPDNISEKSLIRPEHKPLLREILNNIEDLPISIEFRDPIPWRSKILLFNFLKDLDGPPIWTL